MTGSGSNELPGGRQEHVLVDAVKGTREVVPRDRLPAGQEADRLRRPAAPPAPATGRKQVAFFEDHNVWLWARGGGSERRLSRDGTTADGYGGDVYWSPDSARLVAVRTRAGGERRVTLVESSPRDLVQPRGQSYPYLKPGDEVSRPKPYLFDVAAGREVPVADVLFPDPWDCSFYHWAADSKQFYFVYNQRSHRVVRLVGVDAATGEVAAAVGEECKTFFDYSQKLFVRHLEATDGVLWASERSGWNYLYRVDRKTGKRPRSRPASGWSTGSTGGTRAGVRCGSGRAGWPARIPRAWAAATTRTTFWTVAAAARASNHTLCRPGAIW